MKHLQVLSSFVLLMSIFGGIYYFSKIGIDREVFTSFLFVVFRLPFTFIAALYLVVSFMSLLEYLMDKSLKYSFGDVFQIVGVITLSSISLVFLWFFPFSTLF